MIYTGIPSRNNFFLIDDLCRRRCCCALLLHTVANDFCWGKSYPRPRGCSPPPVRRDRVYGNVRAYDRAVRGTMWFGVKRGEGDVSECPRGEREISNGCDGRWRVIDQTSGPFYAALCVTPPPPEFLDKTRLMVVTRRHWHWR